MHGSFLLWAGVHDLTYESMENVPVWYYDVYAVRSIAQELLRHGYVTLNVSQPPDSSKEN